MASYVANDTNLVGGMGDERLESTVEPWSTDHVQSDDAAIGRTQQNHPEGLTGGPSLLIMTGPNYSGKSVYLKQVALIVYMAHVGRYVYGPLYVTGAKFVTCSVMFQRIVLR